MTRYPSSRWATLNQSQSPQFQHLLERLSDELGPSVLLTGTPHSTTTRSLLVCKGPAYDRAGVVSRLRSWSEYMAAAANFLSRQFRGHFVLVTTNPPVLPHLAFAAARISGMRYGILVWDLYPEHLVSAGIFPERHPIVRAWAHANRLAYGGADFVVCIGDRLGEATRRYVGPQTSLHVIPNWADTTIYKPRDDASNAFRTRHGLEDSLVVLYSGNLGASHDLAPMLAAAEALRGHCKVQFLVVGDGLGLATAKAEAQRAELPNVRFLPRQPWEQVPEMLAAADVGVVAQDPASAHLSVPSKTYPLLAAGCPVAAFTSQSSDLAALVRGSGAGWVFAGSSAGDDFSSILMALSDKPSDLLAVRRRARRVAEERFSADVVYRAWRDVLAESLAHAG